MGGWARSWRGLHCQHDAFQNQEPEVVVVLSELLVYSVIWVFAAGVQQRVPGARVLRSNHHIYSQSASGTAGRSAHR